MLARQKAIFVGCSFSLIVGVSSMRASTMTCPLLEVSSIATSEDSEEEALRAAGPDHEAPPSLTSSAARADAASEEVTVIALGPILDSLDSHEIKTGLECTADGAMLVATITRHSGGVKKNVLWRPRIKIVITPRRPEAVFQATWKMRRTDGTELDHVGAHQKYPVIVTTTIRSQ